MLNHCGLLYYKYIYIYVNMCKWYPVISPLSITSFVASYFIPTYQYPRGSTLYHYKPIVSFGLNQLPGCWIYIIHVNANIGWFNHRCSCPICWLMNGVTPRKKSQFVDGLILILRLQSHSFLLKSCQTSIFASEHTIFTRHFHTFNSSRCFFSDPVMAL